MPETIVLRDVPDDLHRRLLERAASEGLSLSDYLLRLMREVANRPTPAEMRARLAQRSRALLPTDTADAVRAERRW